MFCQFGSKMAAPIENIPHVQAKFFTKQLQYAIPDSPFSVPVTVGISELSSLVNSVLHPDASSSDGHTSFDFLVLGEFLRGPLQQHLEQHNLSTEAVVELEYVQQDPAPEPEDSLIHDDWVSALSACNDFILSGCYDNTVRIWNTEGDSITTIPGHSGPVKCVAWIINDEDDPNKVFVTGSHDESLLLWQWNQQRNSVDCVHTCRGHAGSVECVAVNQERNKLCSGSWDKMLKLWSCDPGDTEAEAEEAGQKPHKRKKTESAKVPTRTPLVTLSGHNEAVSAVRWLSNNEVCTASWDHTLRIWDLEQTTQKSTISGTKVYFDMDYSPVSRMLIAASADRHIRLYDPRVTDGAVVKANFTSHTGWVSCVAWSPTHSQQFISGSYDGLLKLWDTRSPKAPLYDMRGHEDRILAANWSMPQYMLSGGADNTLKIFSYKDSTSEIVST